MAMYQQKVIPHNVYTHKLTRFGANLHINKDIVLCFGYDEKQQTAVCRSRSKQRLL